MTNGIRITNLPQFRNVLREYAQVSKRDDKTIVATKMFYIARGASRNTYRTPKEKIRTELQEVFQGQHVQKATSTRYTFSGLAYQAPSVALIINSIRGKRGEPGLYGADMAEASRKFVANRLRSRAFIASGWEPAIKKFEPLAEKKGGAPKRDPDVKQFGRPQGLGLMVGTDVSPKAIIENFAVGKSPTGDTALVKWAGDALDLAFANELASIIEYIRDRKQQTANKYNARR